MAPLWTKYGGWRECFFTTGSGTQKALSFIQKGRHHQKAPVPDNDSPYRPRIQSARRRQQQPCKPPGAGAPNPEISEETEGRKKGRKKKRNHQSISQRAHTAHSPPRPPSPGPAALWAATKSRFQSAGSNPVAHRTNLRLSRRKRGCPAGSESPSLSPPARATIR